MLNEITITQGTLAGEDTELVSARDLHEWLGSKQEFAHWMPKRISGLKLQENVDYLIHNFMKNPSQSGGKEFDNFIKNPSQSGGRPKTDYIITLDTAKMISQNEGTDKGLEVCRWFIARDKQLKQMLLAQHEERIAKAQEEAKEAFNRSAVIKALMLEEAGEYTPLFPKEYYEGWYDFLGWQQTAWASHHHPGYIGQLTTEFVYSKVAPYVQEELDRLNPPVPGSRRRHINHRFLSDTGRRMVEKQIEWLISMFEVAPDINVLRTLAMYRYEKAYGAENKQLQLFSIKFEPVKLT